MPFVSMTQPASASVDLRCALPNDGDLRFVTERLVRLPHPSQSIPNLSTRSLSHWQVQRILRDIDEGLDGPLRLAALASAVRLSSSYFCRAFKVSFNISPHSFIMRMRVERAKRFMLGGPTSLAEIALGCGFSDQAHLSRLFRRLVGETPSKWRRRHFLPN